MKYGHILELIDDNRLRDIEPKDMDSIRAHVSECDGCRRAFDAAVVSSAILEARLIESESALPSPFFTDKVMNAIRDRASAGHAVAVFQRWWQASFSVVAGMLIVVFALAAVALLVPAQDDEALTPQGGMYNPESVIMDQMTSREFTNEQALQEIYNSKTEVKK